MNVIPKIVLIGADARVKQSVQDWLSSSQYELECVAALDAVSVTVPGPLPVLVVCVTGHSKEPMILGRLSESHPLVAIIGGHFHPEAELELLGFGVLECVRTAECSREVFSALIARARARFGFTGPKDQHGQMFRALCDSLTFQMAYRLIDPPNAKPRFIYVSAGVQHLSGLSREDVLSDPLLLYNQLVEDDRIRLAEAEKLAILNLTPLELEVQKIDASGRLRWVHIRSFPTKEVDGTIIWDGVESDITDYKRAEEDVTRLLRLNEQLLAQERVAREKSEQDGRLREEFLATLSHELRTPINAVLGWTQLIQKGVLSDADYDRAIDTIARNARAQDQMISDLLDMSRIISNGLDLEMTSVDLRQLLLEVFDTVRPAAEVKGLDFTVTIEPELNCMVRGDRSRLYQIFLNILVNAVKFTSSNGSIHAEISRESHHELSVSLSDTGIGIDPVFLPLIFGRFRQADSSFSRKHGGLGIGLAIVKHLIELHSGSVTASSPGAGEGSTFTVTLPAEELHSVIGHSDDRQILASADTAKPLNEMDIVLVDDDPDSLELSRQLLTGAGARVITASDGFLAMEVLSRPGAIPDAIVSDIAMPGMDGIELLSRIRREIPSLKHVPSIALTAFARGDERTRVLAGGYDLHISKPVNGPTLVEGLLRFVRGNGQ